MNKLRLLLIALSFFVMNFSFAQEKNIFLWKDSKVVIDKSFWSFPEGLFKVSTECLSNKYAFKESLKDVSYLIELYKYEYNDEEKEYYDVVKITEEATGKVLLQTEGPYGTLVSNIEYLTAGQSKAPYLKLPLDDNSFALFFAGLVYTGSDAPEMMIVVVNKNSASVVFDKMACVYKYTPYPKFSIEYVEDIDWMMTLGGYMPPASVFNKLKRFKIWQEGNILKYKPLN